MPGKPKTKDFGLGMGLVTIGCMLLAIAPLETQITRFYIPPPGFFDDLLWGGIILCLLGILAILLVIVRQLAAVERLVKAVLEYLKEKISDQPFEPAPATEDQFDALFDFSREMFGEEIDEQVKGKMRSWHRKNSEYLWIVNKIETINGNTVPRLVGYFSVFPLTKKAAGFVEKGELYGSNIRDDDMVGRNSKAAAVYIGGIAAKTRKAQSVTLVVLMLHLQKLLRRGVPLYTRPVTHDGRRLVKKYGFVPIRGSEEGEAWKMVHKLTKPSVAKMIEPKLERRQARTAAKVTTLNPGPQPDGTAGTAPLG